MLIISFWPGLGTFGTVSGCLCNLPLLTKLGLIPVKSKKKNVGICYIVGTLEDAYYNKFRLIFKNSKKFKIKN